MAMGRGLPRQIVPMLPPEAQGYQGYQGYGTAPQPVQSVAEILSQGSPGQPMPDLSGATSAASRQRQIADMLLQGAQRQDNTSIAGGLSQLGQAFLARRAGQKADTAEDKQREMASLLMQQAMQGGDQGNAAMQQLVMQNPDAVMPYISQVRESAERQKMLGQLSQMPGITPQQQQLLGMGIGVDQVAAQAFAGPRDPMVVNDRVVDPSDPTRVIADYSDSNYERVELEDGVYEFIPGQPDSMRFLGKAAAKQPLIGSIGGKQESAFATEAGKIEAQNFGALVEMGQSANRNRVILDQLDVSSASVPGGLEAIAKTTLGNFGIETAGLTELQATEALINQLVPAQRQPGSGPMSDKDLALFKQSLPRLIQTQEGRAKIIQNMKAINDYVAEEGRIASSVLTGVLTPEAGRNRMQALGNPLAGKPRTGAPSGPIGADLEGLRAPDGDPVTEEDVAETMRKYGVTRDQVIARLRGQ